MSASSFRDNKLGAVTDVFDTSELAEAVEKGASPSFELGRAQMMMLLQNVVIAMTVMLPKRKGFWSVLAAPAAREAGLRSTRKYGLRRVRSACVDMSATKSSRSS